MCSAPRLGCAAGSPPALRLVAGEGLGAGHLLCLTAPLLPVSAGTWELQKSFTSLLWPCTYRSYQPLLEGTVSHEDPHTAAQHLMHPGVGEVLWLCWLPLDLAERPDFVTSKGFSLPKMRKKKKRKRKPSWIRCQMNVSGQVVLPHLSLMSLKIKQCTVSKTAEGEKSCSCSKEN